MFVSETVRVILVSGKDSNFFSFFSFIIKPHLYIKKLYFFSACFNQAYHLYHAGYDIYFDSVARAPANQYVGHVQVYFFRKKKKNNMNEVFFFCSLNVFFYFLKFY